MTYSFGILLILLFLCSVCVATVMAGKQTEIVEDGVNLLKFDDSPTILDPRTYDMTAPVDFVVDGNQFYWVRIGNETANGLTTVWWAIWLSILIFSLFCGFFVWYLNRGIPRFFPNALPKNETTVFNRLKIRAIYSIPLICIGLLLYFAMFSGILPDMFTHASCDGFVDAKASDGTILLQVDKVHPDTNTLYMKSGVNLTALTHLSGSGAVLTTPKLDGRMGIGVTMI